jgi:hypothetical protein
MVTAVVGAHAQQAPSQDSSPFLCQAVCLPGFYLFFAAAGLFSSLEVSVSSVCDVRAMAVASQHSSGGWSPGLHGNHVNKTVGSVAALYSALPDVAHMTSLIGDPVKAPCQIVRPFQASLSLRACLVPAHVIQSARMQTVGDPAGSISAAHVMESRSCWCLIVAYVGRGRALHVMSIPS